MIIETKSNYLHGIKWSHLVSRLIQILDMRFRLNKCYMKFHSNNKRHCSDQKACNNGQNNTHRSDLLPGISRFSATNFILHATVVTFRLYQLCQFLCLFSKTTYKQLNYTIYNMIWPQTWEYEPPLRRMTLSVILVVLPQIQWKALNLVFR